MWTVDRVFQFCLTLSICQRWRRRSLVSWLHCLSFLPRLLTPTIPSLSSQFISLLSILSARGVGTTLQESPRKAGTVIALLRKVFFR